MSDILQKAKDFLQGKWLGHPLHPALVHLPAALWPAAFVFDVLSLFSLGGNAMVRASFYAIAIGLVSAGLAAPAGLADWFEIKPDKPARKLGWYHMILNFAGVLLWVINLISRVGTFRDATAVSPVLVFLSLLGVLSLVAAAYLGGMMVYDHGVGVARMSKEKWRRFARAGGANVPS